MTRDLLKIGTNTAAQLASKFVTTASTLIVTLLVTRSLSQSSWGIFVTITSYVALFYVIADFGLNGVVTRQLVTHKEKTQEYFSNLLTLRIVLSAAAIFIALATLTFTQHSNFVKFGIIIALVSILTSSIFNSAVCIFQTKLRYDQAAIADISGALVTLVLAYLFIISHFSIIFVVVSYVVGSVVRSFISLTLSGFSLKFFGGGFNVPLWRRLILTALPLGFTLIFSQFVANADKQIVYLANYDPKLHLGGELSATFYGLAYRIFEFGIILPAFFVNSVYPLFVRDKDKDLNLMKENLIKYSKILVVISIFATLFVFIFSSQIVNLFGDYQPATGALKILSLSYPFFYITPLLMWAVVVLNKEKLLPFVYGFAALFNLAANLYFVPRFGFSAAAVITLLTEFIILVWILIILAPSLRVNNSESR